MMISNKEKEQEFMDLKNGERELNKNEIANYLKMYLRFIKEMVKNKDNLNKKFFDIFLDIMKNNSKVSLIKKSSLVTEYDYMLQIVELFCFNKFFSLMIDSNIEYLLDSDIQNIDINDSYYVDGSNRFNLKELIKLIRNAINHNDKDDFQLFRLISISGDVDISLEIYLRRPNLHMRLKIRELQGIMNNIIKVRSAYGFSCSYLNNEAIPGSVDDLMSALKEGNLKYGINHIFNYNDDEVIIDGISIKEKEINLSKKFSNSFVYSDEQIEAIFNNLDNMSKIVNSDARSFIACLCVDCIPFGMSKVFAYLFDMKYLLPFLFDSGKKYIDFIKYISNLDIYIDENTEAKVLYQTLNTRQIEVRALSFYLSYILDSVITTDIVIINKKKMERKVLRNAFVHGRWYDWIDSDGNSFIRLFDYKYGDNNILNNCVNMKLSLDELYKSLNSYIIDNESDLPIDIIMVNNGELGIRITFKENKKIYYCNMSLVKPDCPVFLIMTELNGKIEIALKDDRNKFYQKLRESDFTNCDKRFLKMIKKIPIICEIAFRNFLDNQIEEDYINSISVYFNELRSICTNIKLDIGDSRCIQQYYY